MQYFFLIVRVRGVLIFFNLSALLTGTGFRLWKGSFDCSAVINDIFSVDRNYILLSKFNQVLSFVLVVKCWDNTSVSFIAVGKSVSIFVLLQMVIFLFPEKILFS